MDAFGEESIELRWMERAGAGAFLDVLVAAMIGAAALLITQFEIQAGLALISLVVLAVVDAGVRYALARRRAS